MVPLTRLAVPMVPLVPLVLRKVQLVPLAAEVGEVMGPLYHARVAKLGCFRYITLCYFFLKYKDKQ